MFRVSSERVLCTAEATMPTWAFEASSSCVAGAEVVAVVEAVEHGEVVASRHHGSSSTRSSTPT